jgi:COMPASS component SPP1
MMNGPTAQPSMPNMAPRSLASAVAVSNNAPGFKYKYPEARPTPEGVDDAEWNKLFTAADSRFYNKAHKNANASKVKRSTGETYTLALQMLQEKRDKATALVTSRNGASSSSNPTASAASTSTSTPKVKAPPAKKPQPPKQEPSSSSREMTPTTMDMAERIKTEGRPRKAPSVAPSSDHGTPAPTTAPKAGSAAPAPPKAQKPGPKKGTAGPAKKQQDKKPLSKSKIDGMSRHVPRFYLVNLLTSCFRNQSGHPIQLSSG